MASTTKITITLSNDQVAEVAALVESGRASSISAFAKHAISVALADAAGWKEMLNDALQQTGGPLTTKERQWADQVLGNGKPRRKKKAA